MRGFIFNYLFLHNKCADVLTPSFIRTRGSSHTKRCLPLHFLAVSPDRLTQLQQTEAPYE